MKLESSIQIFKQYLNTKFHEDLSIGSRLFHADERTDMTKVIVTFRNFSNAAEWQK